MCFFVGVYTHHAALDAHRDVILLKRYAERRCVWTSAWLYMWWAIEEVATLGFQLMLLPAVIELLEFRIEDVMHGYLNGFAMAIGFCTWLFYAPKMINRRWEIYRQDTSFKHSGTNS